MLPRILLAGGKKFAKCLEDGNFFNRFVTATFHSQEYLDILLTFFNKKSEHIVFVKS